MKLLASLAWKVKEYIKELIFLVGYENWTYVKEILLELAIFLLVSGVSRWATWQIIFKYDAQMAIIKQTSIHP